MSTDDAKTVPGSCLCRKVTFEVTLPSRFCSHCHCDNCRRAHGTAFVTWAGFVDGRFRFTAGEERVVHYETETGATRSFCGNCGSTLLFSSPRWAGEVHVALSNLEGEIDRAPSAHVYVDHGAGWWQISDSLPRYGGETGMEKKAD
jgi:hypothetical protein